MKQITDPSNKIIIDWLSFTTKEYDPDGIMYLLGMEHITWQDAVGAKGYKRRMYYNGISIHYDGRIQGHVWVEMSGQGCRAYETFGIGDFELLFDLIRTERCNVTRLDIAYDDIAEKLLDIDQIARDTRDGFYVSRSEWWEVIESSQGTSVMFGSPQSEIRIRIYDKAAERNLDRDQHWVRVELQLRRERALGYLQLQHKIGECFCQVIHNYLWFADRTKDTNKQRWTMADYWAAFLCGAAKHSIYIKPGVEYNLEKLDSFVFDHVGNAIECAMNIYGDEIFKKKLKKRHCRDNPKYKRLEMEAVPEL